MTAAIDYDRVIDGALDAVRHAQRGTRNGTLNASAFTIGRLVGAGFIGERQAVADLENAAAFAGIPQIAARATVRSGLRAGMRKPWGERSPDGPLVPQRAAVRGVGAQVVVGDVVTSEAANVDFNDDPFADIDSARSAEIAAEQVEKIERAKAAHAHGQPIAGTRGAEYLASRGITQAPGTVLYSTAFNGLSVPLTRPSGELVAHQQIAIRPDLTWHPKKTNGKMFDAVFEVPAAESGMPVAVVDGPEDALMIAQIMGWRALATCGKARFRHAAAHVESGPVVLIADRDGTDLTEYKGAVSAFRKKGIGALLVEVPGPGKDVGDLWAAGGEEAIRAFLVGAMEAPSKPLIQLVAGGLHLNADEAERALLAAGAPIYQRGQNLVKPAVQEISAAGGRRTTTAALVEVRSITIIDQLSRCSTWVKFDSRSKALVTIDPCHAVANIVLARVGEWRFPVVAGIVSTPILRPDGTVCADDGYDQQTRMILVGDGGMDLSGMPEEPTRQDGLEALAVLDALLVEFPFVSDADRAVGLSALITPTVRAALSTAPLHAVRAPTPGSGKSFLVDVASAIASGKPCPVLSAGKTEEEAEKRLGAALLEGMPLVSLDNLNGELSGDQLCQLVERPLVRVRPLGRSELIEIESKATVFATGNNLRIAGDMTRRAILCELDAGVERPELRRFTFNPVDRVLADRGRYVAAAMTVVRSYVAAGCPDTLPTLASFDDWSRLVRSALMWLGCADPCSTMERVRDEDPVLQSAGDVIRNILDVFGCVHQFTARNLVDEAVKMENDGKSGFREALLNIAGRGGVVNTRVLGRWLADFENRPVKGFKIVKWKDNRHDGHSFKLLKCN